MTDDSIVLSNRTLQFCLRPFLVILQEKFVAKARMSPQFFMRHCESMLIIADMLEKLPLSLEDRFLFCICPVDTDDHMAMGALLQVSICSLIPYSFLYIFLGGIVPVLFDMYSFSYGLSNRP